MADKLDDFDLTEEEMAALRVGDEDAPTDVPDSEFEDTDKRKQREQTDDDNQDDAEGDKSKPASESKKDDDDEEEEDKASFEAFLAKHKDKSPEELLRLAYQQDRARAAARGQEKDARRQAEETSRALASVLERMERARQQKLQELESRRRQFEEDLRADPDAATRHIHERLLEQERREFDQRQWQEHIAQQTELARRAIPDFDNVKRELVRYAVEEAGYSPQEVAAASDYRDLVTLNKARLFDSLVKQGVLTAAGQLANAPKSGDRAADLQRAEQIAKNAPRTLSDARGGKSGSSGAKSLVERARALAEMDDDAFSKLDEKELSAILRELG